MWLGRLLRSPITYWACFGVDAIVASILIARGAAASSGCIGAVIVGVVVYSFLEYAFHRWPYHRWRTPLRAVHRVHHRDRSVVLGAPIYSLTICAACWTIARALVDPALAATVAGTILLGYAIQAALHALIHSERALLLGLRRHHLRHHADATVNFGLLTTFWDRVLGTRAPPTPGSS
jgi:sterol desaturase/sphingolipid hydroxylase (fatty acid hydroxylase superfamily)